MAIVKNRKLHGRPKTLEQAKAEDQFIIAKIERGDITKVDANDVVLVKADNPSKEDVEKFKKIFKEAAATDKDFVVITNDEIHLETTKDVKLEAKEIKIDNKLVEEQPKRKAGRPPKKGKK